MKTSVLIIVLSILTNHWSLGQANPMLIKDNLVGKDNGIPMLNPVDEVIIAYKGKIIYGSANHYEDLSTTPDYEIWQYDPATKVVSLIRELLPLKSSTPNKLTISGNKLFFGGKDKFSLVDQVYVSDGTFAGTYNVGDTLNGLSGMLRNFSRNTISPISNGVIFNGYIGLTDYGLWFSDGSNRGTININKSGFADNFILHSASNNVVFTQESKFKISDGTIAGTKDLNDLINFSTPSNASVGMGLFNNNIIMEAYDPISGDFSLFMTNGISSNYTKLINFGNLPSGVRNVIDVRNNRCLFSNKTGIWSTDGTANGTFKIPNIVAFSANNFYTDLWTYFNGKIYFSASDATNGKGVELYVSDGTIAGTKQLLDINPGSSSSNPFNFKVYNNILYFSATTENNGNELWQTDGTTVGTRMIADINPSNESSSPQYITGLGNDLYFAATDGTKGYELWKYSIPNVAVNNVKEQNDLSIYPTITQDYLNIRGSLKDITKMVIMNEEGKIIKELNKIETQISLANLGLMEAQYYFIAYKGSRCIFSQAFQIIK